MIESLEAITGAVFGRVFRIEARPEILALFRPRLPWGWTPVDSAPERVWRITSNGGEGPFPGGTVTVDREFLSVGPTEDSLVHITLQDLELWAAENAVGLVVVHAGVVVVGGKAIVIPGRSQSGKSTLVHELVQRGATYYSDEFAPLDSEGFVWPYARPLHLRNGSSRVSAGHPSSLSRVPVGLVIDMPFAQAVAARELSRAGAVMSLLAHTLCASSRPSESLETIGAAVRRAKGVTGTRGEAEEAAEAIFSMVRKWQ